MHSGEFFVYADSSVFICFLTLVSVWTACAVLALIYFFLMSILITIDMFAIKKCKCFPIGASHNALCIKREIYGSERIAVIILISCLFFEHRKFHVFFHSMLLTVNVIVIGTIAGIRYRIFGIKTINSMELFHQRNKAVRISAVVIHIHHSYVFICNAHLNIVGWQQLVIPHVIGFDSHKSSVFVCLWIAVSILPTDSDFLNVFFEFFLIFQKKFVLSLLNSFVSAPSMNKGLFIELPEFCIFVSHLCQIIRNILGVCWDFHSAPHKCFIHVTDQCGDFIVQTITGLLRCLFPYPGILVCICLKLGAIDVNVL